VTIEVTAKQFAADGRGKETEEPLDSWFDVAVFAQTDKPLEEVAPLYIEKHRLRSGKQVLTVRTTQRPGIAALDPFHKRIERSAGNNSGVIAMLPFNGWQNRRQGDDSRNAP
jgi:ABC-2 type transport system permease protein